MEKTNRLGIVGGLGPETSSKFCLNLNKRFRSKLSVQPSFVMENVPVPLDVERSIVSGKPTLEMLHLLKGAVLNLNKCCVDFIVIPCNTVHVFINELRAVSKVPLLSIIEECAFACKDFTKVGLIGTSKTVKEGLFCNELDKFGVELVVPKKVDQKGVDRIILNILSGELLDEDRNELVKVIKSLDVDVVILGCTDLGLLVSSMDCGVRLLDTRVVLEESSVKRLIGEKKWN